MRETLAEDWPVERMAKDCNMSLRTFLRRFKDATGMTPGDWLMAERVEAAKTLLCGSDLGIDMIAMTVGFGSAHALRHHFRNRTGLPPSTFRHRFLPTGAVAAEWL
jgi:AraC family transcriptional regulator, transcriptional activator FtrA